jgi:hypothetical protein
MIRQCLVAVTLLLAAAADADRHPYAFERPLASSSAYITHRVGVPFVHRTDQEVSNPIDNCPTWDHCYDQGVKIG